MATLKQFRQDIQERFVNLLPQHDKRKAEHADEVWNLLQKAYAPIGGLHTIGFSSKEDMIKNIPMWKLHKRGGEIKAVAMYKDRGGRKKVAIATDGSAEGKRGLADIYKNDAVQGRSYSEISKKALTFAKNNIHNIEKHLHTRDEVRKIFPDEEIRAPKSDDPEMISHPELKDHLYQRKMGVDNAWNTKVLIGKPGNPIV